jgi:dipeptidyl aminopeptidase/acylaminoacyl peptidase
MNPSSTIPFLLAAALTASSALAQQQQRSQPVRGQERGDVPLISRDVLFGNPDRAQGRVSPDGNRVSFIAPVAGVLNVHVAPADDISAAKPVTSDTHRGIRQHFWAYDSRHILYVQDKDGDENWRVYSVDLDTGETADLTPLDNVQARIVSVSQNHPDTIIVGLNHREPHQFHDLYRVNINTAERTLVYENNAYAGFEVDEDYNIRFAVTFNPDGSLAVLKAQQRGDALDFQPFWEIPQEDTLTTSTIGFDASGQILYYTDSRGRNTAALFAMDMATGESRLLAEHPRADAGGVLAHPQTGRVQAIAFNYDRVKWQLLDKSLEPDFTFLRSIADGDITVTSRTLDDSRWTVAFLLDNGPARTYLYDRPVNGRGERNALFLFSNRKDLEGLPLARMHPVIIKSRDGLDLVSYLSLPPWTDTDNDGRPDRPLPLILNVHGGPWARDAWGFNSEHQWLANRGYAVLSVNYRGSTGFGKDFINAANFEWAGKMHDDLIDAVDWAIHNKIADESKVAIMGGSYGGYATLVGLTFTPDRFAAGIDIVGPSDLMTLLQSIPPYWKPIMTQFTTRVGDPATEEGRALLQDRSPIHRVDQIKRPLLIGQGANDPRVKQAESDQIVSAMQNKNIPVTYVLYPDEGHGFARPENRMSFYAVAEAFLKQHLGGRHQPIGEDFNNSSIQVPAGADQVPGVKEALKQHNPPKKENGGN